MKVGELEIGIKRSKRSKTITVNIERDGSVNAVAPWNCSDDTIYKELQANTQFHTFPLTLFPFCL